MPFAGFGVAPSLKSRGLGHELSGATFAPTRSVKMSPQGPPQPQLRVAIVAASLRILGGQAVQAQRLLDGWRGDAAVSAWLVPIDPVPPAPWNRLLAIRYIRTITTQLFYWPLLVRELRKADVVHVFSASYWSFLLAPLPAVVVARLLGKRVVVHYHSGEAPDHLRRSWVARFVLRHVDLNVVPSTFLRDVFESFGIPALVVANTIDVRRFAYRPREPFGPHLISTRNFEPMYNVACTLRAFARVQAVRPDASLTIVGAGSQANVLRTLASDLGLHNVVFTGPVAPDRISACYADADIYVQTPSIDNMPNSVIEAFASGACVVATDIGGVPAILTHGQHGLLVPDDDDAAVARAVLQLLDDPDAARRMAAAARASCDRYQWDRVRGEWLDAYRRVATVGDDIVAAAAAKDATTLPAP
jgi:glycosyltransferase involved in cell wall biosynthesis